MNRNETIQLKLYGHFGKIQPSKSYKTTFYITLNKVKEIFPNAFSF